MIVSITVIVVILFTCDNLRRYVISKTSRSKLPHNLILDVIVSIELCAVSLELGVVFTHYGFWYWLVGLYINSFYQCIRWRNVNPPCPYFHMVDFIAGQSGASLLNILTRCAVLVGSGLATYHLILTPIWKLEISNVHVGRGPETAVDSCTVPWAGDVSVTQSFVTELIGTFILDIGINLVLDNPTIQNNEPMIGAAIVSGMVAFAVSLAFDISGGMFNPMLATVLLGGCKGNSMLEHITIYWIGSSIGAIIAFTIYPRVKDLFYATAKQNLKTKENEPGTKEKAS